MLVEHLLIRQQETLIHTMTFAIFKETFLKWTEEVIEAKQPTGFPICPFARKARLQGKIQFIDALTNTRKKLETFDKNKYEIGIAWVGDQFNESAIQLELDFLKEKNPDLLYFISTTESGHFAKNFTNCVFIQLRGDINSKREYLQTTSYYDNWPKEYFNSIFDA